MDLSHIPPGILKERVLPLLSHDDIANVSQASSKLFRVTTLIGRRESAVIMREKRCETLIGYLPWGVNSGASVFQRQPFRFILRTTNGSTLQVNIKLSNIVWDERHNSRTISGCRRIGNHSSTSMDVEIWQKRGNSVFELLFKHDPDLSGPQRSANQIDDSGSFTCTSPEDGSNEQLSVFVSEKKDIRLVLCYIWRCVQHIARFPDGRIYPSAEYMMSVLPRHLRTFFPATVECNNWIDGDGDDKYPNDRDVVVEWDYRPAKTREEWYSVLAEGGAKGVIEFQLDELPWYKPGYWLHIESTIDCMAPPVHHADTLWGNVFVQAARPALGYESIHFVSPGKAYISYESRQMYESGDHPENRLRVYFQNVSFDGRTFRGEVANQGPVTAIKYFRYVLTFDSTFTTIVFGEATGYLTHSRSHSNNPLGIQDKDYTVITMTNAALWDSVGTAATNEGRTRDQIISDVLIGLLNDGASDKHLATIRRIASATSDPVDCTYSF